MTRAPDGGSTLLVHGGTVVTMDAERRVLEEGAVAVADGAILEVGPAHELRRRHPEAERIDAAGQLVLPGLVNAHVHGPDSLFRGLVEDLPLEAWLECLWRAERRFVSPESVALGARLALAEMLSGGITAGLDMFFHPEASAEAAREARFRLLTGPVLFDTVEPDGLAPEEQIEHGADFLERWADDPLVVGCVQPHNPLTVAPELMVRGRRLADEHGVLLHTHCSETAAEVRATRERYDATPVGHLEGLGVLEGPTVLAHTVHLTGDDLGVLARRGTVAVHNPVSNLKLGSGIADLPRLGEEGVPVLLGTDGPVSSNDLDLWTAMRFAALLPRGVREDPTLAPAREVVEMVTRRAAEALGLGDRIGSLEPGKRADLILVDERSPHLTPRYDVYAQLVFAAGRGDVSTVLVDGEVVVRDGEVLTLDVPGILEAVGELSAEIAAFDAAGPGRASGDDDRPGSGDRPPA